VVTNPESLIRRKRLKVQVIHTSILHRTRRADVLEIIVLHGEPNSNRKFPKGFFNFIDEFCQSFFFVAVAVAVEPDAR
jgi:hypothetical protein